MRLKWNIVLFDELTAQGVKRSVTNGLQNKDDLQLMNSSASSSASNQRNLPMG